MGATKHSMRPLHEENELEFFHCHVKIDFFEFRKLLVLGEFNLPVLGCSRQRLTLELPLHHGEAGASETSCSAKQNHDEHKPSADEQPNRYRLGLNDGSCMGDGFRECSNRDLPQISEWQTRRERQAAHWLEGRDGSESRKAAAANMLWQNSKNMGIGIG